MLVFVTYVFGDYYRYIPYYVFGINHSYPEADIKIFVDRKLTDREKKTLYPMNNLTLKRFNIDLPKKYIRGGNGKAFRWLIPYEELKVWQYAYIGDVDMLIAREEPTLMDAHLQHMKTTGLPFSNGIRPEGKRMTGLHFIDIERYYKVMNPIIGAYLISPRTLSQELAKCERNEHFLYRLLKRGFNFNGIEKRITEGGDLYYRPHHGLHLGLLRGNVKERIEMIPSYVNSFAMRGLLERSPLPELNKFING